MPAAGCIRSPLLGSVTLPAHVLAPVRALPEQVKSLIALCAFVAQGLFLSHVGDAKKPAPDIAGAGVVVEQASAARLRGAGRVLRFGCP